METNPQRIRIEFPVKCEVATFLIRYEKYSKLRGTCHFKYFKAATKIADKKYFEIAYKIIMLQQVIQSKKNKPYFYFFKQIRAIRLCVHSLYSLQLFHVLFFVGEKLSKVCTLSN